jgi:hypothetical protein
MQPPLRLGLDAQSVTSLSQFITKEFKIPGSVSQADP